MIAARNARPVMLLAGLLLASGQVFGQATQDPLKSDPLDPSFVMPDATKYDKSKKEQKTEFANLEKGVKAARNTSKEIADNVLRGLADVNSAKSEFDRYFNGLIFPLMTQIDNDSLYRLGVHRDELLKSIQETPNDSAVRRHLLEDLTIPYFTRVANDSGYHPAVRLNAILILGNLNRREGQRNVEPALPMETALRILLNVASAAETPNYLKIGALAGILRHANIDGQLEQPVLDSGLRQQCIDHAIAVIAATVPAENTKVADEQYWMRRQAVQILGAFRAPGAAGGAIAALRTVLDDPETPLMLAADAIDAYGLIRFPAPEQADVANVVKSIGQIANRFFTADVQSIDEYIGLIKDNRLIASKSDDSTRNAGGSGSSEVMENLGIGQRGAKKCKGDGASTKKGAEKINFPAYKINDVRQRSKYISFIARRALDGLAPKRKNEVKQPENLKALADPATQKTIEQMVAA